MAAEQPQSALETLVRRLAGHTAIYAGGSVAGLVLAMAQVAVLTRLLETGEFGRFAVLLFYSGLITLFCNLGVVQGSLASGFSGGYSMDDEMGGDDEPTPTPARGDVDNRRRLTTGLATVTLLTAAITALSAVAAPQLATLLLGDERDAAAVVWATAAGGFGSLWRLVAALPRFERRPLTYVGLQVSRYVLIVGSAALLIEAGYGLAGAMAGFAIGKAVGVGAGVAISRHRFRRSVARTDAVAILRRGRPFVLISITFFLSRNLDLYLLSRFVPDRDVAVYLVAGRVGLISSYAVSATLFAWGPLVRGPIRVALERQRQLELARASLVTYYVLLATWVVVGTTVLADVLVRIAPSTYADAATLVPVLSVAAAAHGGLMVVYRMSRFPLRTRALRRVGVLSLVVMAVSAAALIPPFEGLGAALASALAPIAAVTAMVVLSQRGPEPLPLRWGQLGACLALGAAFIAAGLAARVLPDGAETSVDAVLVLGFPALLLGLGVMPRAEVRRLVGLLGARHASRAGRRALPAELGRLDERDLELLEALLRGGESVADLAARRLEPESAVASRLTAVLRRVGEIGEPSAADERIGRYLLLPRTATHREQDGHMLSLDPRVAPMEVDRLAVLAGRLRTASDARWQVATAPARVPGEVVG